MRSCYGMKRVARKGPLIGATLLLAAAGAGIGALASSVTSATIAWRAPARFAMTEPINHEPVDQSEAGRSWARVAFDGGLRRCPEMNASFLAACEAEMKALQERPAFAAGSYGGPLLITEVEPVAEPQDEGYRPRREPVPEIEVASLEEVPAPTLEPDEVTPANYPALEPSR
jgi:hypothetical protein